MRQWKFVVDMNFDGVVTIRDVMAWIGWLFYYPGDYAIFLLISKEPSLAQFFEINYGNYGGLLSLVLSLGVWVIVFFWIVVVPVVAIADYKDKKDEAKRKEATDKLKRDRYEGSDE